MPTGRCRALTADALTADALTADKIRGVVETNGAASEARKGKDEVGYLAGVG